MSYYKHSGVNNYITQGTTKQYYYIYKESDIKYLLTSYKSNPARPFILYDVIIESRHPEGTVNHGDHIDFGIIRRKSPDTPVIIKTHHTLYTMDLSKHIFSRDAPECNFVLREENMTERDIFLKQKCEDKNGNPITESLTMANIYPNSQEQNIIFKFINVILTDKVGGNKYETLLPNFTNYLGKFIEDVFIRHLNFHLDSVRFFFDLNENNITMMLDFDYMMSIVLLNKDRTIKACYVHKALQEGTTLGKRELKSYRNYLKAAQEIADTLSYNISNL
jgi:hypothetical protein